MDVKAALCSSPKSNLKYDRCWNPKEVLKEIAPDEIAMNPLFLEQMKLSFSPPSRNDDVDTETNTMSSSSSKVEPNNCMGSPSCVDSNRQTDAVEPVASLNIELNIINMENDRLKLLQRIIDDRREVFHLNRQQIIEEATLKYSQNKLIRQNEEIQQQKKFQEDKDARYEKDKLRQQKLNEDRHQYAKILHASLKEAEQQERQQEVVEAKRAAEISERLLNIHGLEQQMTTTFQKISESVKSCINPQLLSPSAHTAIGSLKEMCASMQIIIERCKQAEVTSHDLEITRRLVQRAEDVADLVKVAVGEVNDKLKSPQTTGTTPPTYTSTHQYSSFASEVVVQPEVPSAKLPTAVQKQTSNDDIALELLSKCISKENLKRYTYLKEKLNNAKQSCESLITNPQWKKYRFDLQKAINTIVNAISSQSGSHAKDKLDRLSRLLHGHRVDVGDKWVSSSEHPQGCIFCMDLLAKKFVRQGDEQVAAKPEASFVIAAIIIGVWKQCPEFGELFLGHLYDKCPYLVPYYTPMQEDQSQEDYYKALGYNYTDGVIEKQDKFLKRMSGFVLLYAAIIYSPLPHGLQEPHPHGLEHGWTWLTSILRLAPQPDITATVIFDFLEVCGHGLQKTYRHQFQKLLHLICRDYFAKIKQVTPGGSGGPTTRLENFLHKCLKEGRIPPPEGNLPSNFWYT